MDLYPPGTVPLQDPHETEVKEVILQPQPTSDPNDPLNWSKWSKSLNFALSSFYTLMIFVLVDIGTVIYGPLIEELHFSIQTLNWSFGANTAGLALGCVMFIPFALKFGRRPIYLLSIAICFACSVWSARMHTPADQYGINILAGLAGSVAETICQMTIADVFFVHQRATANGIYLVMVNVGAFLAPVAAGYSADAQGWRWIWWWTAIFMGVCLIAFVFLYEETKYTPIHNAQPASSENPSHLRTRKPSTISQEGKKDQFDPEVTVVSSQGSSETLVRKSYLQRLSLAATSPGSFWEFFRHVYQPFEMLFTLPAVAYTALMWGSVLAWFSVILSTLSIYMTLPPYNFSSSGIGLMNLPPFIGSVLGSLYGGYLSDWLIVRLSKKNHGIFEPEMRLWLALPVVILTPGGIAMFGLSMTAGFHWIVPAVGLAIFGFGFNAFGDISLTYLMDCYRDLTGDALVAVAFVRNAFATAMVFALQPWINSVGLQNMFITITCMSFAMFATTIPMLIWGKMFRIKTQKQFLRLKARQFAVRE